MELRDNKQISSGTLIELAEIVLKTTFLNSIKKLLNRYVCVYIFGRFTFRVLGQALLLWYIVCFLTLKYCYLLLSLFISITIIFTIISIITVTIIKYIVITFQFFTTLTTYILAICWFKIWFPFCLFFF